MTSKGVFRAFRLSPQSLVFLLADILRISGVTAVSYETQQGDWRSPSRGNSRGAAGKRTTPRKLCEC